MRARDVYILRRQSAPSRGRWWRRVGQFGALIAELGPVPGGGEEVLIVERATGATVGDLRQPFGDEFYAVRLEEDLLTLPADAFEDKWLGDSDGPSSCR